MRYKFEDNQYIKAPTTKQQLGRMGQRWVQFKKSKRILKNVKNVMNTRKTRHGQKLREERRLGYRGIIHVHLANIFLVSFVWFFSRKQNITVACTPEKELIIVIIIDGNERQLYIEQALLNKTLSIDRRLKSGGCWPEGRVTTCGAHDIFHITPTII